MGALGLPGDLSSMSRFVRVAYTKLNAVCRDTEAENVSQFFHILGAVEQQRGCCEVEPGAYEYTIYTSCCNAARGVYYYTTYDNHQITAVDLHRAELDVASNTHARHLYERLGFTQLGVISGGFRMKDGHYEDICPYYHTL